MADSLMEYIATLKGKSFGKHEQVSILYKYLLQTMIGVIILNIFFYTKFIVSVVNVTVTGLEKKKWLYKIITKQAFS
mgnify:CR=1 FL=1